jgi:hypothetical protein
MHGGKETFEGDLLSLVPESEHERWRLWVGSVAWDKLGNASRVVLTRAASTAATVSLSDDDDRLRKQVRTSWAAFLLTGAAHSTDPAWVVSGLAGGSAPGAPLRTFGTAQEQERLVRPFYRGRQRHLELEAAAMGRRWAEHRGMRDDSWFHLWLDVDDLLSRRVPRPAILSYALVSYSSAVTRQLLEFSTPEFVRAAEGILALPVGKGRSLFRDRALRLVPTLRADSYVGSGIEGLLVKLYELRSMCVHGKLPFHDMQARGDAGEEEAAQLGYVAEVLARGVLLFALRRPDWSVFRSRDDLERAWASDAFP